MSLENLASYTKGRSNPNTKGRSNTNTKGHSNTNTKGHSVSVRIYTKGRCAVFITYKMNRAQNALINPIYLLNNQSSLTNSRDYD